MCSSVLQPINDTICLTNPIQTLDDTPNAFYTLLLLKVFPCQTIHSSGVNLHQNCIEIC